MSSPRTDYYQSVNIPLGELLALPNEQAAVALNTRMHLWDQIDSLHERSYVERGQIAQQFERRMLWQFLEDPHTGAVFASFAKWMASGFLGCRSVNYESLRDMQELRDVPADKLRDVPKSGIKMLKCLSGSVRQQDAVLEAAKTLPSHEFAAMIATKFPDQHIEVSGPLRFSPTPSQREVIENAIQKAIEDGARDRNEALEYLAVDYMAGLILEQAQRESV